MIVCVLECESGYFQCFHGGCISSVKVCDSHIDCNDLSDEINCSKFNNNNPEFSINTLMPLIIKLAFYFMMN